MVAWSRYDSSLELYGLGFLDLDLHWFEKANPSPNPNPWNILNPKSNPIQGQNEIQVEIQIQGLLKSISKSKSIWLYWIHVQIHSAFESLSKSKSIW